MDLRCQNGIKRKLDEAFAERNEDASQRQMAREYRDAAKRVRLEEEFMDRKADKTAKHAIVQKAIVIILLTPSPRSTGILTRKRER